MIGEKQLIDLMKRGASVVVDGMHFNLATLEEAAKYAQATGGHLTIKNNGGHGISSLESFVMHGGKNVTIDLS